MPINKNADRAAAPGSKTTHIAMLMKNSGEIAANDVSRERIYKLQSNIERYGITNIEITNQPGETLWKKYPEYFDRVLLDAPCSMEGRFDTRDTTTFEDWSLKKIKKLAKQQCWLLRSAVSATKVGGTIIYSSCTLAPEENEAVIQWLLEKEKNTVKLENIDIPYVDAIDGLTQWQNKDFNSSLIKTKRILPTKEMEGFFIAKIKKVKSNVSY
jgi:16S rRNA (cytosine1407-C5)-methyltransferase